MAGGRNTFFAMMSRMKYIERWALMRNSAKENISEHSLEVAIIAHALAVIGNTRLGKNYNPEHIAMLGVYHDCTEIITGDMPTPVKYNNDVIRMAYKEIEAEAAFRIINMLPEDMQEYYIPCQSFIYYLVLMYSSVYTAQPGSIFITGTARYITKPVFLVICISGFTLSRFHNNPS